MEQHVCYTLSGSEGDVSGKTTGLPSSVLNRAKEEASDSRDKQRSQSKSFIIPKLRE